MKKTAVLLAVIFVLFSVPVFAAPLSQADVKPILDRIIPNAAKIYRIWRSDPRFDKTSNVSPNDGGSRYITAGKSFPYKSVSQIMKATSAVYSKRAIEDVFTIKGEPEKFKEENGRLLIWSPNYDGTQRAKKWIRKGASIERQKGDSLVLKCRSQDQFTGKIQTSYMFLIKENGVWKLDQDIDVAYSSPVRMDRDN